MSEWHGADRRLGDSYLARVFVFFHLGVALHGPDYSKIEIVCLMYVHFPRTKLPKDETEKEQISLDVGCQERRWGDESKGPTMTSFVPGTKITQ